MNELMPGSRFAKVKAWAGNHRILAGAIPVAIGLLLGSRFFFNGGEQLHHLTAKVLQGEIRDTVEATGTLNAVITVQVGSQVSGIIDKLNADFNTKVHKGEVIALISPQLFEGALLQASADLADARANVTVTEAGLGKAQAGMVQSRAEFARATILAEKRIASDQGLDLAKATYLTAKAAVDGANACVIQAKAQVRQKEAAVFVARTNLNYTVIRSPIDGTVVARNVDVGQTVAASLQAPTIFTIAQDLTKMRVYTKVDESDVGRITVGKPVSFKVDAYPKEDFRGRVGQIRMNPTQVQNVVTYDSIIDFANPDSKLFPGMTAYVTIPVATVVNAVKLPNAALRYHPPLAPETVRGLYGKFGINQEARPTGGAGTSVARPAGREDSVVWKLRADGSLEPVQVSLGITDHTYTEVTGVLVGSLQAGDDVVTTSTLAKTAPPAGRR